MIKVNLSHSAPHGLLAKPSQEIRARIIRRREKLVQIKLIRAKYGAFNNQQLTNDVMYPIDFIFASDVTRILFFFLLQI